MPDENDILDPVRVAAQAWLDAVGLWPGVRLLSHSCRQGKHTFKGTAEGHRWSKPAAPNQKAPAPSDTVRFVAIEDDGVLVRLEEISTSERKYTQAHGKLPMRLRPHFLEPQMDKIADATRRLNDLLANPEPGLMTWRDARAKVAQELYDLLDTVVQHPKVLPPKSTGVRTSAEKSA
jgi:hypothetical protein